MRIRMGTTGAGMFGYCTSAATGFVVKARNPEWTLGCDYEYKPVQSDTGSSFLPVVILKKDPCYQLYISEYGHPSTWPANNPNYEAPGPKKAVMSMAAFMSPKKNKKY